MVSRAILQVVLKTNVPTLTNSFTQSLHAKFSPMFHNKNMRKIALILVFLLFSALTQFSNMTFAQEAKYNEQVNLFSSTITVNQDTSISITEQIDYQTSLEKHGIFRYIPVTYNVDGTKKRLNISNVQITDELSTPIQFEQSHSGPYLNLKIGDPNTTFSGQKTYIISYKIENALNTFPEHDELYWDITGEGWQIPILRSEAKIMTDFATINQVECFTGAFGGTQQNCEKNLTVGEGGQDSNTSSATFTNTQEIDYGDNFTVIVGFEKPNSFIFPTQLEKTTSWLMQNWPFFLIPLPTLAIFLWWWKKGRDYQFISANVYDLDESRPTRLKPFSLSARAPYVYHPIENLSPGEAGALLDERVDSQDVVAEILELARKKYLKIELIEKKKLLGKERDYQLSKLKNADESLTAVQKLLHDKLFNKKDQTKISELKGKFYTTMASAKKLIDQALVDKKVYTKNPGNIRALALVIYISAIIMVTSVVMIPLIAFEIFWPIPVLALQIPIGILLAFNMVQKTAVGYNLWLQTKGLRKSIKYGKWREEIKEKNLFIEEVFPFAVSLGVVSQLARHMKELNIKPPEYLHASGMTTWNTSQFVSGFSSEVSSSLSYNPSSSSSSGGSGFSGGSSGGGGGGGGGGSW